MAAAPLLQEWWTNEFGPTGTANGGVYADKSYWVCTENWDRQNYPVDTNVYSQSGGFGNGLVPLFIVVGYGNKVYYDDNGSDFRVALRTAIDEMTHDGVYVSNPISDRSFWPYDTEDIDVANVFADSEGDPITITLESNSEPSVVDVSLVGNTLTLTASALTSGTTTIILKGEDVANTESATCEFVVTIDTKVPVLIWDFESNLQGWRIGGDVSSWQYQDTKGIPSSDSKFLYIDSDANGGGSSGNAMSPIVDLSSYSSGEAKIGFRYYFAIYNHSEFQIRYTLDGGTTWILIANIDANYKWSKAEELIVPDEALTASTQFGFWYSDLRNVEWFAGIDDVYLAATPKAVPVPTTAITPIDSAIDVVIDGSLEWNSAIRSTGYKLFFGTDNPPTNILNGVDMGIATSYDYSDLSMRTSYYWQVVPYNYLGDATGCSVWDFITFDSQWNGANINPLSVDVSVEAGMSTTDIVTINAATELSYTAEINYISKSDSYRMIPNTVYNSSSEKSTGATSLIGALPSNQDGLGFSGSAWLTLTDGTGNIAASGNQDVTLNFDATEWIHEKVDVVKTAIVTFKDKFGNVYPNSVNVTMTVTNVVGIDNNLVTTTDLSQNYPNPFNPSTAISFSLENDAVVNLSVYNITGQVVATLVNSFYAKGAHTVNFNAEGLTSGVYHYTLKVDDVNISKKMLLVK